LAAGGGGTVKRALIVAIPVGTVVFAHATKLEGCGVSAGRATAARVQPGSGSFVTLDPCGTFRTHAASAQPKGVVTWTA
jgi:hypothetical protein